jgi:hypothetical protein
MKKRQMVISIRQTSNGPVFTITEPWLFTFTRRVYYTPSVVLGRIAKFDGPVKIRKAK